MSVPFAAALFDDSSDDDVASVRDAAHSQVIDPVSEPLDASESCIARVEGAAMHGAATPKLAPLKRTMSASTSSSSVKKTKRQVDPNTKMRLKLCKEYCGVDIKCVFVPRKKGEQEAIPLWPQFTAKWRDADFGDTQWLSISTQCRWVKNMVNATTNGPHSRKLCEHLLKTTLDEFSACLTRARAVAASDNKKPNVVVDSDSESGCDDIQIKSVSSRSCKSAALHVTIGGYVLLCMNTKKQFLIAVNAVAVDFIRHWMLPLVLLPVVAAPEKPKLIAPVAPDGFQFSACRCPTITGKVFWKPDKHMWKIRVLKPKTQIETTFKVDATLPADEYALKKESLYREAVTAWNNCDGSKRFRIKLAPLPASFSSDSPTECA